MATARFHSLLYTLPFILTSAMTAAQSGDGGQSSGNVPSSVSSGDLAGAAGPSSGSVSLSTGATVAIAVVVAIVVILGISTAVLFYLAKKRQWDMKEKLRQSRRRIASGIKTVMSPLTPHRSTFSPGPFKTKFTNNETRGVRGPHPLRRGEKNAGIGLDVDMETLTSHGSRERDLEKGEGSRVVVSEKKGRKPKKPSINIPKTGKTIDAPPKTPMFNKMFGRE